MRWMNGFAIVVVVVLLSSCSSLPIQEMSDARQAISAAREARAEIYAPFALSEAERLLDSAEASLILKDYALSQQAAISAKEQAVRARSEALEKQDLAE